MLARALASRVLRTSTLALGSARRTGLPRGTAVVEEAEADLTTKRKFSSLARPRSRERILLDDMDGSSVHTDKYDKIDNVQLCIVY